MITKKRIKEIVERALGDKHILHTRNFYVYPTDEDIRVLDIIEEYFRKEEYLYGIKKSDLVNYVVNALGIEKKRSHIAIDKGITIVIGGKRIIPRNIPLDHKYKVTGSSYSSTENTLDYGVCENCGRIISNKVFIEDENGVEYMVGTECIDSIKLYDASEKFKIAEVKKQLRNEAKFVSFLRKECTTIVKSEHAMWFYSHDVEKWDSFWKYRMSKENWDLKKYDNEIKGVEIKTIVDKDM